MSYIDDFGADAGDRIKEGLVEKRVGFANNLADAAVLAGKQLELLKPIVMGGGRPLYVGPVATVTTGTILIVLANEEKVATIHLFPHKYRLAMVHEFMCRAEEFPVDDQERLLLIREFVEHHGSSPGGKMAPSDTQVEPFALVGALFSGDCRDSFVHLDEIATRGRYCPVAVGLIGPASSGRPESYSAAWPLTFMLAPYAEAVVPGLVVEPEAAD